MIEPKRKLRVLSALEIRQALPMRSAVEGMKLAFRELSTGEAVVPPRLHLAIPKHEADVLCMPAYSPTLSRVGVKVLSLVPGNREVGLPFIQALVLVLDAATGSPLAIMDGASLTAIRTGAASGAATDLLARADAAKAAIFGAGIQARTQLEAVCAVRPIRTASVCDVAFERASAFAGEMTAALGIPVCAAATSAEALDGADVVCTATTSPTPVFADGELAPGAHINAVGSYKPHVREIPPETVARAWVAVDQIEAAWEEAGDLIMPLRAGLIGKQHIRAEIGELVAGTQSAPTDSPRGITFFKSVGLAVQDLVAAEYVLRRAQELGIGTEVAL